ncbi:MAG: O-antigen ligase family protein [Clostridia bacterium]|nr:O-antigen ligase family protein [Clostridia bacterium]
MLKQRLRDFHPGLTAVLTGILWLAVFPLWQDGSFSRITRAKLNGMHTLAWITIAVTLITLGIVIFSRRTREHLHLHPVQALAAGYFLWIALSAWQGSWAAQLNGSGQPAVWMGAGRHEGLQTQLFYAAIFLCMSLWRPRLKMIVRLCGVTLMVFFAITVMQYAGQNPLNLFPAGLSTRTNYEFQGTIGNIDMVSGYLCLCVPLLLGSYVLEEKPSALLLVSGACGMLLQMMIEVQSGLIALAAGLALLAILLLRRPHLRWRIMLVFAAALLCAAVRSLLGFPWLEKTADVVFPYQPSLMKLLLIATAVAAVYLAMRLRRNPGREASRRMTAIIALSAALALLLALLLLPLPEGSGIWEIQQALRGKPRISFGSYRLGVWQYTLDIVRQHPLFGGGPDTFLYAMKQYLTQNMLHLPETFDNPHNEYLAILCNNGLPALLIYLCMLGTLLVCGLRAGRSENLILSGAVLTFMLQGFFSFSICLVTPMFWAVCGMACAWCGKDRAPAAGNNAINQRRER